MVRKKVGSVRTSPEREGDVSSSSSNTQSLFPSIPIVLLLLFLGALFGYVFHPDISKVVHAVSEIRRTFSEPSQIVKTVKQSINEQKNFEDDHTFENSKYAKNSENFENDAYDAELQNLKEKYKNLERNEENVKNDEQNDAEKNREKVEELVFEDDSDLTEEEYMRIRHEAGILKNHGNKKYKPELKKVERNEDLMESEIEELDMKQDLDEEESVKAVKAETPSDDLENEREAETSKTQKTVSENKLDNDPQTHKGVSKEDGAQKQKTVSKHQDDTKTRKSVSKDNFNDDSVEVEEETDAADQTLENNRAQHVTFDSFEAQQGWTVSGDENIIKLGGRTNKKTVNMKMKQDPAKNKLNSDSPQKVNPKKNKKPNTDKVQSNKEKDLKTGKSNDKSKHSTKSGNSKKTEKQKDPAQDDSESIKNDPNLPDEVKNFKPTYQKTLTPKKTFIDGRRVPAVELLPQKETNSSVKVYLYDEFLSDEEADGLIKAHDAHVKQASQNPPLLCFDGINTLQQHLKDAKKKIKISPKDFIKGTTCVNQTFSIKLKKWLHGNWSYSTAFYPGESRFSSILAARINNAMGLKPSHGGKFQLTSYPIGKAYKTHTDCTVGGVDKRDRMASVLIYLNTVKDGGKTEFPDLGIWVKPRKGRALLWNNMNSEGICDETSRHEAAIVKKGHKYILIRWYYYQNFYSLGKRPDEPAIPQRKEGQPRVSCDEYNNGSCRWYDEWGYDHLLDYQQQKLTLI